MDKKTVIILATALYKNNDITNKHLHLASYTVRVYIINTILPI